jgi:repressor LexA
MKEATERQKEVLDFIAGYIHSNAYPPTIRDVADHFSISVKGAHDHLSALRKKGYLRQGDKKSRTLMPVKPVNEENEFENIPILGTVAAGRPILAVENMEGSIRLHRSMLKNGKNYFALRVKGDSMEKAGIMDGDTAVIVQQNVVRNGEIAVVMLEDSVTIKRFYRESTRIRLQPESPNPMHTPIYYSRDLQILGKLAYVFRSYETIQAS